MGGTSDSISPAEARSALAWWLDMGVDVAVQEASRDWLNAPAKAAAATVAARSALAQPRPSTATEMPETLDLFRDWLRDAPGLPLASDGATRVLPHGAEGAPVMLIAEMPGRDDAAADRPVGGEAWALAERMLGAIGIDPGAAYSASLSCFHAPGTRIGRDDLAACADIARRHVALVKPKRLLLLGDAPSRALLGKPLAAARGHVHKVEGVRTIVSFHPRLLLDRPSDKALAWRDLLLLMEDDQ